MLWKQHAKGVVFVAVYVNDNVTMGNPEAIEDTIEK